MLGKSAALLFAVSAALTAGQVHADPTKGDSVLANYANDLCNEAVDNGSNGTDDDDANRSVCSDRAQPFLDSGASAKDLTHGVCLHAAEFNSSYADSKNDSNVSADALKALKNAAIKACFASSVKVAAEYGVQL